MAGKSLTQRTLDNLRKRGFVAHAWRVNAGMIAGKYPSVPKGTPDICGYTSEGRALFVEVKDEGDEVSTEQAEFFDRAMKHACFCFIVGPEFDWETTWLNHWRAQCELQGIRVKR